MGLRCSVKGCGRSSRSDIGHSFFGLPKDAETRRKWLEFVGKEDGCGHVRVCSDHFDIESIRKRFPRPLLARNTVPTIRKLPQQNSPSKTHHHEFVDEKHVPEHSLNNTQLYRNSPSSLPPNPQLPPSPETKVINIHPGNVSQIIISGGKSKLILNIINENTTQNKEE